MRAEAVPVRIRVKPFQTVRTFGESQVQRVQRQPVITQPMLNQGNTDTIVESLPLEFQQLAEELRRLVGPACARVNEAKILLSVSPVSIQAVHGFQLGDGFG
jgi:hypothetical protein